MHTGLYARVSTHDQQTLGLQAEAMSVHIKNRGWLVTKRIEEIGSGSKDRPRRESLLSAARRREIDVIVVWRLDRRGRSVADLMTTLRELLDLGVGFVSLTEALDLTTPSGRAMAGMLRVRARDLAGAGQGRARPCSQGGPAAWATKDGVAEVR